MKKTFKKMSLMTLLISSTVGVFGSGCILDNPDFDEYPDSGAHECGDNMLDSESEDCDDGNKIDGDGCSSECKFEIDLTCGDGKQDLGEQCDDGNLDDGDGCSSQCQNEDGSVCGDGDVTGNEQCDDGNTENGDGCNQFCETETSASCGDGKLDAGEQCDDGNLSDGDGCDSQCQTEAEVICGDGIVDGDEQCDDGNTVGGDGCDENCQSEAGIMCGNGILEAGEQCDDGNQMDDDGCSAVCQYEECGLGNLRQCGEGLWSFDVGAQNHDSITSIATDSQGNIFAAGNFIGDANLNPLGASQIPNQDGGVFLVKYNPDGQLIWFKEFENSGQVVEIETDAADNVYMTGHFYGSFNLNGPDMISNGMDDIFVAKFDPNNGTTTWAASFGGGSNDRATDLSVNGQGDIALGCHFYSSSIQFGQSMVPNGANQGTPDACIVKLNLDGAVQWARSVPDAWSSQQSPPRLVINPSGQVYWAGDASLGINSLDFGNGVIINSGALWMVKYDVDATPLWGKGHGVNDGKLGRSLSMALDPQGQIWLAGNGLGINLGDGPIGNGEFYIANFDANSGNYLSSLVFNGNAFKSSLSFDYQGNMIFSGLFQFSIDFGLGPLPGQGITNFFLVKFDSDKTPLWNKSFSHTGGQTYLLNQNRTDPQGYVILGGAFTNTLYIEGKILEAGNYSDGFLAKFYP